MGRKPLGLRAMTNAEKQKAQRKTRSDELKRLRAIADGFMRCIQTDNKCDATGQPCGDKCGCQGEIMEWSNGKNN